MNVSATMIRYLAEADTQFKPQGTRRHGTRRNSGTRIPLTCQREGRITFAYPDVLLLPVYRLF